MEDQLQVASVSIPIWPEPTHAQIRREGKLTILTYQYLYPSLFYLYFIALWILFVLWKIMLVVVIRMYTLLKKLEKKRLKRRLVIVGGGYAGTVAAKSLEHDFLVTLIDNKDYFEFTPSKLRMMVEPTHAHRMQVKHSSFLSKTLIVMDWVKHITPEAVITENQSISYDYLLICTGSRTPDTTFNRSNTDPTHIDLMRNSQVISVRTQHLEDYHLLVDTAQSVLIIGGGTVGVELAGEIIDRFKGKKVTIVQSSKCLMPRSPERAIRYSQEFFERNDATIIFGDRVESQDGRLFRTKNGAVIEADIAFVCTGNIPNTDFMRNKFFGSSLNPQGFVKVNQYLQLEGYNNIFVAGDLTDIPEEEEKLCQTAAAEVKVVVNNLRLAEAGLPPIRYVPGKCPILISLGKYDGILTYRGWTYTGFVPAAMKEFVEWKEMVHYWNLSHFQPGRKAREHWSSHAHIV
eukprot:TRINITY_DN3648_c0_g3_i1.p1 TRINITY_DN3648_c0_g3~~TRINITY_DN3648_c0_g3_i1.p1  ORF type:complete len:460 (+),score=80.46 TRINITY_DN3648_c0_g3_i1:173-1552(+)